MSTNKIVPKVHYIVGLIDRDGDYELRGSIPSKEEKEEIDNIDFDDYNNEVVLFEVKPVKIIKRNISYKEEKL
jgi:hypothetical protein